MRKVLVRGTPPADWIAEADAISVKLRAARSEDERRQIIDDNDSLWRDPRIRNWLKHQFNSKCWYSEAQDTVGAYHVDHYRPKCRVRIVGNGQGQDGYWWLSFHWKNYRICGQLINTKKSDYFPIRGTRCGEGDDIDYLDTEGPVLIDPATDQARLISFDCDEDGCRAVPAAKIPVEDTERASETIETFGLNRLDDLNSKRKMIWDEAKEYIEIHRDSRFIGIPLVLKLADQARAKDHLKKMIRYESEFSSVAEACIEKEAPGSLRRLVFAADPQS